MDIHVISSIKIREYSQTVLGEEKDDIKYFRQGSRYRTQYMPGGMHEQTSDRATLGENSSHSMISAALRDSDVHVILKWLLKRGIDKYLCSSSLGHDSIWQLYFSRQK